MDISIWCSGVVVQVGNNWINTVLSTHFQLDQSILWKLWAVLSACWSGVLLHQGLEGVLIAISTRAWDVPCCHWILVEKAGVLFTVNPLAVLLRKAARGPLQVQPTIVFVSLDWQNSLQSELLIVWTWDISHQILRGIFIIYVMYMYDLWPDTEGWCWYQASSVCTYTTVHTAYCSNIKCAEHFISNNYWVHPSMEEFLGVSSSLSLGTHKCLKQQNIRKILWTSGYSTRVHLAGQPLWQVNCWLDRYHDHFANNIPVCGYCKKTEKKNMVRHYMWWIQLHHISRFHSRSWLEVLEQITWLTHFILVWPDLVFCQAG